MTVVSCPHCNSPLKISEEYAGETVQCPKCSGALIAPGGSNDQAHDEPLSIWIILAVAGAVHLVAYLFLIITIGPTSAMLLVVLALGVEAIVWNRSAIFSAVHDSLENAARRKLTEDSAMPVNQPSTLTEKNKPVVHSEKLVPATIVVTKSDDDLVEIRPARQAVAKPKPAPRPSYQPPTPPPSRPSMWGKIFDSSLEVKLPNDQVYYYGPGTELDLGRGVVKWPLVYATGKPGRGGWHASVIDGSLSVAPAGSQVAEPLSYWPSYYDCSPSQRAKYLDWLLTGKSDPDIDLGYVFIYFYGLEQRSIVDRTDFLPIAQELIRLLGIYSYSNSFRRYTTSLLWMTIYQLSESTTVPSSLINDAIAATSRWNDDLIGYLLAIYYRAGLSLPSDIAVLACQCDSRSTSSVIVRRHRDEFEKLFAAKYATEFPQGMKLRAGKRSAKVEYQPASGSLIRNWDRIRKSLSAMPDVLAISSQFRPLIEIWESTIDELKAFSRIAKKTEGELTAEAYEALPRELQDGDHPDTDSWMEIWDRHADEEGRPIVPIGELATLKGVSHRKRLTKTQCTKLLGTADALGIGVEPDARSTGDYYLWDERVTLFFLDGEPHELGGEYVAAATLLRLGASIAEADGKVDDDELRFISNHLEGQFNLSDADSKRLECLQYLLLHSRSGENAITNKLVKRLSRDQRLMVGEFLVGVAAIDEVITDDEQRALRKAYKMLDLRSEDLDALLRRHADSPDQVDSGSAHGQVVHLDLERIAHIMTETRQVAGILQEAMQDSDEMEDEVDEPAASSTAERVSEVEPAHSATAVLLAPELDSRYAPFLTRILEKEEWTTGEMRELSGELQVMLSGAVEAVNEWSLDRYGDWLIEEGEPYLIRKDLMENV
ncbi:tellurite resistance TerB family protein [Blastopirellula retiformator]|uniref:Tellurite resistance protein TerB n=1 Tax=Blastopirellula retiformator TaxID=2527970 RepID=A0A5C5V262_9BACT|nr:TerB N-terminal domain-containing protein [Blastopirellula retiformator]TWT31795.1 Tellurite resistance protein TerB [Blastopirellula retiformator]